LFTVIVIATKVFNCFVTNIIVAVVNVVVPAVAAVPVSADVEVVGVVVVVAMAICAAYRTVPRSSWSY